MTTHGTSKVAPGATEAGDEKRSGTLPEFLRPEEAAELLRLTEATIRRKINAGDLPGYRVQGGNKILVRRRDVLRLLEPVVPAAASRFDAPPAPPEIAAAFEERGDTSDSDPEELRAAFSRAEERRRCGRVATTDDLRADNQAFKAEHGL